MSLTRKLSIAARSYRLLKYDGWFNLCLDWCRIRRTNYTFNGIRMRPNTSDRWIALEHKIDRVYSIADEQIKRAKTVIDVGANVGLFATWVRERNPDAQIACYEPFWDSYRRIPEMYNVVKLPLGVTGDGHKAKAVLHDGDFANVTTVADPSGDVTVNAKHLLMWSDMQYCDVLKLDCEGEEKGILENLDLTKVGAVIVEWHPPHTREEITAILKKRFEHVIYFRHMHLYAY